jgi:hypothetical protein
VINFPVSNFMKIRSALFVFRVQFFCDVTLCHSVLCPSTLEDEGNTEFHKYWFIRGPKALNYLFESMDGQTHADFKYNSHK